MEKKYTMELAGRGEGFAPETFAQVDVKTNMPHNSAIFALMACAAWFVYFIFSSLGIFGDYGFDSSELPIITIYPLYIPILLVLMVKEKDLHPFKRFALPILSFVGIGVIIYASIRSHGMRNLWYLIVFAAIMLAGFIVMKINERNKSKQ